MTHTNKIIVALPKGRVRLKGDSTTIIVGILTFLFQKWTDLPDRNGKEMAGLNCTLDQLDISNIYRILHTTL